MMSQEEILKWEGTLSHTTMRNEDLGPCFLTALETLNPRAAAQFNREFRNVVRRNFSPRRKHCEETDEAVTALFDALDAEAPEGYYFGATEGDGSDYGFWKISDPM